MVSGNTSDSRSLLAGKRFGRAVDIFFSSYEALVENERWEAFVNFYETKQIRNWPNKGVPEKRISQVATAFGLEPSSFTDNRIADRDFEKTLYNIKLKVLAAGKEEIPLTHIEPGAQEPQQILSFPPAPDIFIGRGNELDDFRKRLKREPFGKTAIHGWPGVGKTTLLSALANDTTLHNLFPDGIIWMTLGLSYSCLSGISGLGRSHLLNDTELMTCTELGDATDKLRDLILGRRFLFLLDDVFNAGHVAAFDRCMNESCAFILTTRFPEIARLLISSPDGVVKLELLSQADAMTLLHKIAPQVVEHHSGRCSELLEKLGRLPLAIHVAGRMLKRQYENLRDASKLSTLIDELIEGIDAILDQRAPVDLFDSNTGEIPTVTCLLNKSTELLTPESKLCFAAIGGLASKPATFDFEVVKKIWSPLPGIEDPAAVISDLADRGLIEPLNNGRYQIHALLKAHAERLLKSL